MVDKLEITGKSFIDINSWSKLIKINKPKFIEWDVWNIFCNRNEDGIASEDDLSSMRSDLVSVFIHIDVKITNFIDCTNFNFVSNMRCANAWTDA